MTSTTGKSNRSNESTQYATLSLDKQQEQESEPQEQALRIPSRAVASTVVGAALNFTNSIVGAGCIGFGAAMAASGGLMAVAMMLSSAYLNKLSMDLLVELAILTDVPSYEGLGQHAYGTKGKLAVVLSKGIYAFGSLVAYIIIVKDNFAPAARHLWLQQQDDSAVSALSSSWSLTSLFLDDTVSTIFLCATIILPLCLLRDMKPLERFSAVKIATFFIICFVVAYLWATTDTSSNSTSFTESSATDASSTAFTNHWLVIRPGFVQSMGTFVFTFIAQHTVHLVFDSLGPPTATLHKWQQVSTLSIILSILLCFPVGLFVYMTFWQDTSSNLFGLYADRTAVDVARILLCVTMLLTYPTAFFSCRQVVILSLLPQQQYQQQSNKIAPNVSISVISSEEEEGATAAAAVVNEDQCLIVALSPAVTPRGATCWLLPGDDQQLLQTYHVLLTTLLWAVTLLLALAAPSLGDVLNLLGCALGTLIAFVLPSLFSYRLRGYTATAALLFVVGGVVGCIGTYLSLVQLIRDSLL
jgi:sodium-coupled neutral amino acid transporter 11